MNEDKGYTYIIDDNGNRVLDKKSSDLRKEEYLRSGGLYPFEVKDLDLRSKLGEILNNNINIEEPTIITWNHDAKKTIFGLLAYIINKRGENKKDYMSYQVVTLGHLLHQHLDGDYIDVSEEFINYDIVFVILGEDDFPNMLNSYCIKNMANSRKKANKYTFFYFNGTLQLLQSKYQIDERGDGKRSVFYNDKGETIDNRLLTPITNYVKVFNLTKYIK